MGIRLDLFMASCAIEINCELAPVPTYSAKPIKVKHPVINIKAVDMSPFEKRIREIKGKSKVDEVHTKVSSGYRQARSQAVEVGYYTSEWRKGTAERLGLTPIGRNSAFAELVAVHPELPDVVLKVVEADDAGAAYAKACYEKNINSTHAPVIHAYHEVEGKAFIYMERLIDMKDMPETPVERMGYINDFMYHCSGSDKYLERDYPEEYKTISDFRSQFDRWNSWYGGSIDFHEGNSMFRADGTWVCIDPVS